MKCFSWSKCLSIKLLKKSQIFPFGVGRRGISYPCRTSLGQVKATGEDKIRLALARERKMSRSSLGHKYGGLGKASGWYGVGDAFWHWGEKSAQGPSVSIDYTH